MVIMAARPEGSGQKEMLSLFWDECGVICYDPLQPDQTVNGDCDQQQLADLNHAILQKRPKYEARQYKVIFFDVNSPPVRSIVTHQLVEL
uniref:Putative threoninerich GPIanchored glycoprotein PJ4664.02like [Myotis brandtii] n=1 Tax=Lepeophtheirus salmonis TaxID=72036 RepID=A0A0K2U538_LEPSM